MVCNFKAYTHRKFKITFHLTVCLGSLSFSTLATNLTSFFNADYGKNVIKHVRSIKTIWIVLNTSCTLPLNQYCRLFFSTEFQHISCLCLPVCFSTSTSNGFLSLWLSFSNKSSTFQNKKAKRRIFFNLLAHHVTLNFSQKAIREWRLIKRPLQT